MTFVAEFLAVLAGIAAYWNGKACFLRLVRWYRGRMETHQMTIRIPLDVYQALRREAFDRQLPMTTVITEALQAHQKDTK